MPINLFGGRQRGKFLVRFFLIPKGDGRHLAIQGRKQTALLPTERLDRHPQVMMKMNGIRDMPAIKTETLAGLVSPVARDYLSQAGIWRGKGLIFVRLLVFR